MLSAWTLSTSKKHPSVKFVLVTGASSALLQRCMFCLMINAGTLRLNKVQISSKYQQLGTFSEQPGRQMAELCHVTNSWGLVTGNSVQVMADVSFDSGCRYSKVVC